ncbi:MAG TPA: LysE family translocator [Candidatus Lustribacter sp.]|nr:LysE family translocator [Candidatus Lustribacter sp.]
MSVHQVLLFAAAAAVLIAIPGPNHIYIATRSIADGRHAGLASALGVEAGTLVHTALAAAGLSYLIVTSATAFAVVRYAGAAYLVYLGITTLRRRRGSVQTWGGSAPPRPWRAFRDGVVVNMLNPKVILFFLAFVPQFVDLDAGSVPMQIVVFGAVTMTIGLTTSIGYVLAAGALRRRLARSPRLVSGQRFVVGPIYLLLGLATALSGASGSSRAALVPR